MRFSAHFLATLELLLVTSFSLSVSKGSHHGGRYGMETGGWTQQYGNQYSTSYTDYTDTNQFTPNWNVTTREFVSQTSPSVDEHGTLYYPLRTYVVAIAPNGSTIWKSGVSPNGNSYLTNTLYSKSHDYVIVGSTWVEGDTFFQFVALHANTGKVVWTKMLNELYHPTSISLSVMADAVFVAGFDESSFAAVSLSDGRVLWEKKHIYLVGIFMQTKVGKAVRNDKRCLSDKTKQEVIQEVGEVVLLPTDPWDGMSGKGRLFAYDTDVSLTSNSSTSPHLRWYTDLGFTAGALFAFSSVDVLYGSNSGSVGSRGALFLVNVTSGELVTDSDGPCDRGPDGVSGPAVDEEGFAYFSCGNQMFSLHPNGTLRWLSTKFGNSSLGSVTPPSVHPHGYTYFIHQNGSVVYRLLTRDGTQDKTYSVPELGYFEPPILVGTKFMYLIGFNGNAVTILPIEL